MAGIGKENLIINSDHNKFLQDHIISNSLKSCYSELEVIFSDKEQLRVSCLAVYLVFPFLGIYPVNITFFCCITHF